jgi:4-amino-4-deoxy-L-arabinose transferase-like glycosyltransferase
VPLPDFLRRRPALAVLALGLLLGLLFQGARGLWESDEGRYTNVALQMLHSGDWVSLRRNEDALHFTKPPVTYWAIAASVTAFGRSEWAVRLPLALAYALTILMVFQLGKRFVPTRPWLPALVYACSPLPFLAANNVNTDTMLAMTEALAMLCYVQYRFGSGNLRWLDGMWLGFGLAFLTKGPPGLLPLLAVVAYELGQRSAVRLLRPLGLLGFALVGFSWYLAVILRHPGLLDYFLGHEVYARIATGAHRRNPEWYGFAKVYLPVFVLGLLPWLFSMGWPRRPRWMTLAPESRFLWLWLGLPLLVLCLARSRLWLYPLPLFVPMSLLVARALDARPWPTWRPWFIAVWLVLLVALKAYGGQLVSDKDDRTFAAELRPLLPGHPDRLMFVEDMTRNGLNLYLDTSIERLSFKPQPKMISDSSYDSTLAEALARPGSHRVFIMKRGVERYFLDAVREAGLTPVALGTVDDARGRDGRERVVYTLAGDFPGR